jgi:hypothetical protein
MVRRILSIPVAPQIRPEERNPQTVQLPRICVVVVFRSGSFVGSLCSIVPVLLEHMDVSYQPLQCDGKRRLVHGKRSHELNLFKHGRKIAKPFKNRY